MEVISRKSNNIIIGVIFSSVILIISLFLPFYTIKAYGDSGTIKYFDGDGKIVLILAVLGIIFTLVKKFKVVMITFIISLILYLVVSFNIQKFFSGINYSQSVTGTFGIGFWLGILSVIAGIYFSNKAKNKYF